MHLETILVVDDEPIVRKLIRFCLKRRGYTVLEAESGSEAMDIVSEHRGPIAIALVDVIMPGIHGPQLERMLHKIDPDIQVIFMSGFPHIEAINRGMMDFLSKPFTLEGLSATIHSALTRRQNPGLALAAVNGNGAVASRS